MAEKHADLIFQKYRIGESRIRLDVEAPRIEGKIEINVNKETKQTDEDKYLIKLETYIINESKTLEIEVTMYGYFEISPKVSPEIRRSFVELNAPTIMFPYIRAYISSLTGLSGLSPVIIPAVNFANTTN